MSELDAPRSPGSHRRADRNNRLLLFSLLGVVLVVVGVLVALNWRGEGKKPAAVASASHSSTSASPSASGSTASPSQTGTGGTITIVPPTSPSPSPSPSATPTTASPTPTPTASVPAARLPLDVLNNTHIVGLAKQAARTFESGGWTVSKTGNYTHTVSVTTVFYPVGGHAAADRLAAQFPKVRRVLPAPGGLSTTHLTVVLARDWS